MSNDDVMSRGRYREERQDLQGVDAATVQKVLMRHKLHLSALLTMFLVTAASSGVRTKTPAPPQVRAGLRPAWAVCRRSAPQRPIRDWPASRLEPGGSSTTGTRHHRHVGYRLGDGRQP